MCGKIEMHDIITYYEDVCLEIVSTVNFKNEAERVTYFICATEKSNLFFYTKRIEVRPRPRQAKTILSRVHARDNATHIIKDEVSSNLK